MLIKTYPLDGHAFLATPQMDAFYVIELKTNGDLPEIKANFPMANPDGSSLGLSIELLNFDDEYHVRLTSGNAFPNASPEDIVKSGRVTIETTDSSFGNTYKKLKSFLNGAQIDKNNFTLTAAGIGITDILSGDPLIVELVSAPLTTLEDEAGNQRTVRGVFVEYVDFTTTDYVSGTNTAKIWGIQTVLVPLASLAKK
jgi:hypothetical protein